MNDNQIPLMTPNSDFTIGWTDLPCLEEGESPSKFLEGYLPLAKSTLKKLGAYDPVLFIFKGRKVTGFIIIPLKEGISPLKAVKPIVEAARPDAYLFVNDNWILNDKLGDIMKVIGNYRYGDIGRHHKRRECLILYFRSKTEIRIIIQHFHRKRDHIVFDEVVDSKTEGIQILRT